MRSFVVWAALLLNICYVAKAAWVRDNPCGIRKYANAGMMPLPPGKERMIVGGIPAQPNEFPWQVSIRTMQDFHYCGGSIITNQWILTAAHCLEGDIPEWVQVVVGDHQRNAPNDARLSFRVLEIIMHEDYDDYWFTNDIGLIRINGTIPFSENVKNVCPPDAVSYVDSTCQCSGWGTLSSGGPCCPQTLQYVTMRVTTNAFCQAQYPEEIISADMICATDNKGSTERDSCQGDSGGPLTVKLSNSQFVEIGVVSWGYGCASGWPGVYARVSEFLPWINKHIDAK